ncbi:hypothetical protein [Piscinibacter sakaiensis]|uniref:hypothetical protein n=1 Tax=Piscinibacter sakaiensis TaxID=1547922 RepID=UPI003AB0F4E8
MSPLTGFVARVTQRTAGGAADEAALIDQWRAAAARYRELEQTEAGAADGAVIEALPASLASRIGEITADVGAGHAFSRLPVGFGLVELDRLVVCQQHVSLAHAASFERALGETTSRDEAVFEICFPRSMQPPALRALQVAEGKFVFQSELADLRAFHARLLDEEIARSVITSDGPARGGVTIPVGFGVPHLNVVRFGGRLVLNNGYHRAYALRRAGVTRIPCIVQAVAHPEELAFAGSSSLIEDFDALFNSARPPMLKDFFDPRLTTQLDLLPSRKQVQITVTVETLRAPD